MTFSCLNELRVSGASSGERGRALRVALAGDWGGEPPDEADAEALGEDGLMIRFMSIDTIPEEGLRLVARDFPELAFFLLYISLDGDFCGLCRVHGEEWRESSIDLPEGAAEGLEEMDDAELLATALAMLEKEAGKEA